ncbi:MAG: hypothetical protein A3I44_04690 [Candidatus Sungbacteria bacterium RIFCSPLOWO2_02_FULL_51_17]|nr:MAG: hypothetical protein A2676_05415 [Candidatus Sungbacteria bacterium RIFCSPHIGHO2_01_FULL_51_22]OHA07912.1 MAG: hypothetical protein A3B29_05015 [Candidatus Sungbacteria bacterium RIFCSPLOWO2_01_FULL_51_34]OHA12466.1 MAG: hypothetical protein A3I44_04690 [Candidatus Sungbacteria bacterium RIFCSPLOWO2_02_FULL_51_17]
MTHEEQSGQFRDFGKDASEIEFSTPEHKGPRQQAAERKRGYNRDRILQLTERRKKILANLSSEDQKELAAIDREYNVLTQ